VDPYTDFYINFLTETLDMPFELTVSRKRTNEGYFNVNSKKDGKYGSYLSFKKDWTGENYAKLFKLKESNLITITMKDKGFDLKIVKNEMAPPNQEWVVKKSQNDAVN